MLWLLFILYLLETIQISFLSILYQDPTYPDLLPLLGDLGLDDLDLVLKGLDSVLGSLSLACL